MHYLPSYLHHIISTIRSTSPYVNIYDTVAPMSLIVRSSVLGGKCGCVIIPWMALQDVVWMLIARSGSALVCGSYIPKPPCFNL